MAEENRNAHASGSPAGDPAEPVPAIRAAGGSWIHGPWGVPAASTALFLLSCLLPAIQTVTRDKEFGPSVSYSTDNGWSLLAIGWLGLLNFQFAWLANPMWVAACVCLGCRLRRGAQVLSVLALALAMDTLTLFRNGIPGIDQPVFEYLHRLEPGFFFWVGSMVLVAVWAFRPEIKRLPADTKI